MADEGSVRLGVHTSSPLSIADHHGVSDAPAIRSMLGFPTSPSLFASRRATGLVTIACRHVAGDDVG